MIFKDFDFKLLDSPEFKDDSVREEIILPILKSLGYSSTSIVRSKTLTHPFLTTGATKRKITLVPDYLLKIEESYAWVLDAKSPKESVIIADNVQQVRSHKKTDKQVSKNVKILSRFCQGN